MSMPPEPVTGFCILPRVAMISSTSARTAAPSPPCLLRQLPEARRVEIEPLDRDPHLVGADPRIGVQAPGGLRQHPGRLEHPVQSDR